MSKQGHRDSSGRYSAWPSDPGVLTHTSPSVRPTAVTELKCHCCSWLCHTLGLLPLCCCAVSQRPAAGGWDRTAPRPQGRVITSSGGQSNNRWAFIGCILGCKHIRCIGRLFYTCFVLARGFPKPCPSLLCSVPHYSHPPCSGASVCAPWAPTLCSPPGEQTASHISLSTSIRPRCAVTLHDTQKRTWSRMNLFLKTRWKMSTSC